MIIFCFLIRNIISFSTFIASSLGREEMYLHVCVFASANFLAATFLSFSESDVLFISLLKAARMKVNSLAISLMFFITFSFSPWKLDYRVSSYPLFRSLSKNLEENFSSRRKSKFLSCWLKKC